MSAPVNRFKESLRSGQPQIGLWLGLGSAYAAEICATMGFDWVVVDGEHAPNDIRSTLEHLQAIASYPVHPVVRPPVGETHILKQLLDIGAQTVLVPMVDTAEYARELVAATRYPPAGVRGIASTLARAARWNAVPNYVRTANEQICLLVQVLFGMQTLLSAHRCPAGQEPLQVPPHPSFAPQVTPMHLGVQHAWPTHT